MTATNAPAPGGRRDSRERAAARDRRIRRAVSGALGALTGVGLAAAAAFATGFREVPAELPPGVADIPPISAGVAAADHHTVTEEVEIEPESVTVRDNFVPEGTTKVVSTGKPGIALVTYAVTMADGVEVRRAEVHSVVLTEPTHDVVAIGTLDIPSQPAIQPGSTREIGKRLAAERGFTGVEWQCLDNLWQRESNWRTKAENKSSGAYGIPQSLPGTKMASVASDWRTNPATQITWGLNYIERRYDTPCGAWAAFSNRSPHWY